MDCINILIGNLSILVATVTYLMMKRAVCAFGSYVPFLGRLYSSETVQI